MLSVHGLVIVAEEPTVTPTATGGAYINFYVASETWDKKTVRYPVSLWLPATKVESIMGKLKKGVVCELINASLRENPSVSGNENRIYTMVKISIRLEDLRILKIPFYYDSLKGITFEEKPDEQ